MVFKYGRILIYIGIIVSGIEVPDLIFDPKVSGHIRANIGDMPKLPTLMANIDDINNSNYWPILMSIPRF